MKRLFLPIILCLLITGCALGTPAAPAGPSATLPPATSAPFATEKATSFPTALPFDPAQYQGWRTYTNSTYGFSLMIPEDWSAEEEPTSDSLLYGHLVNLHPASGGENIRVTFRAQGEDTLLWPTGVGQGEFIPGGSLEIAGEPALRMDLVCPTGEVTAIWYHQAEGQGNILRDGLEFGFIFTAGPHCAAGKTLSGKIQQVGEMILASLKLP